MKKASTDAERNGNFDVLNKDNYNEKRKEINKSVIDDSFHLL